MNNQKGGLVIINKSSEKFSTVLFFIQSKCSIFLLLISLKCLFLGGDNIFTIEIYVVKGGPEGRPAQKGGFIVKGERPF